MSPLRLRLDSAFNSHGAKQTPLVDAMSLNAIHCFTSRTVCTSCEVMSNVKYRQSRSRCRVTPHLHLRSESPPNYHVPQLCPASELAPGYGTLHTLKYFWLEMVTSHALSKHSPLSVHVLPFPRVSSTFEYHGENMSDDGCLP